MSKVLLKDIDPREQKQIAAAENAIARGNPQFAAETCQAVLGRHPECTEVRRVLRRAQKAICGNKPSGGGFGKLISSVSLAGKSSVAKSDPKAAMEHAEKMLAKNPFDIPANKLLAAAAETLGLWDAVALAYEEIVAVEPKTENYKLLVNAYMNDNDGERAEKVVNGALKKFPGDGDLQELARQVSVKMTMKKSWDDGGDYRSKIADKEKALELEKKSRVVSDAESAAAEIPKLLEAAQADPENTQIFRDLSRNYKIAGDLNAAIWAIQQARNTTNGKTDATLEKLEHSLTTENYENCIRAAEKVVAENPDNKEYADYLEQLRAAEKAYKLQSIQTLVEKYPNDYNYRYDLGLMLLESGDVNGAIRELQLAQRSPKNRHLAMLNLGRAFIAGGKFDLAADQLSVAKGEIGLMNDLKKDVIYELASALEQSGKRDQAIGEYKALYMADSTYKDVSEKINAFYK